MPLRRKKALPPWLSGVTVTNTKPDVPSKDAEGQTEGEHKENTRKKQCLGQHDESWKNTQTKQVGLKDNRLNVHEEKISVEKLVEMSYDEYKFQGSLIYSHNSGDCNIICEDIISTLGETTEHHMGFDTEWPVTYQKGKQAPTALIQLCLDVNKCYLFHISCMPKLPVMLKRLIAMDNVKKIGLNVENDLWKLEMDYDIKVRDIIRNSTVELRTLANTKLRSAENWSLEGLTKNVLRLRISKDPGIRTCDWSQYPLPEEQQRYAATDAAISLMLYKKLSAN